MNNSLIPLTRDNNTKNFVSLIDDHKVEIEPVPGAIVRKALIRFFVDSDVNGKCLTLRIESDKGHSKVVPFHSKALKGGGAVTISFNEDFSYRKKITYSVEIEDKFKGHVRARVLRTKDVSQNFINAAFLDLLGVKDKTIQGAFSYEPLISIITPIYNTDIELFKQTAQTVMNQSYANFEWILVDDCSPNEDIREYIKLMPDARVKVKLLDKNVGIAGATNEGIEEAVGDYISFLDHDDLLDHDALYYLVDKLQEHRYDIVYSDEDKVDSIGMYSDAHFKPDWNYRLLLSNMYVCHFTIYNADIARLVAPLDPELDGAQDYDFLLRCVEYTKNVGHVARVLYHWRKVEGSTSVSILAKPQARVSGEKALRRHLDSTRRVDAVVEAGILPTTYNVIFNVREEKKVLIIIPFKDKVNLLKNLLFTLEKTDYKNYEVLLVNNNSEEQETLDFISTISTRYSIMDYNKPFNFADMNNIAAQTHPDADLLLFLNNDIEIMHKEWLSIMVGEILQDGVGAVGAKLLYADHTIQHAGVVVGMLGVAGHGHKGILDGHPGYFGRPHLPQEVTAVTGACLLVRRDVFMEVGMFDTDFPGAFNDIDLCLKIRKAGHLIIYTPYARLYHMESVSRGRDNHLEQAFRDAINLMERKWRCFSFKDPYYNINLRLEDTNFSQRT